MCRYTIHCICVGVSACVCVADAGGCSAVERVLDCRRRRRNSSGTSSSRQRCDGVGISGGGGYGSDALLWQRHSTCQRRVLAAIFARATHIRTVDIQHPRCTYHARSLYGARRACGGGGFFVYMPDNTLLCCSEFFVFANYASGGCFADRFLYFAMDI